MKPVIRSLRRPGWFWLDDEIIDRYGPEIGPLAIAVYAALCRFTNSDSAQCRVLVETLATRLRMGESTVRQCLQQLAKVALVECKRNFNGASTYTLLEIRKTERPLPHSGQTATTERLNHTSLTRQVKTKTKTKTFRNRVALRRAI
jgi:hypothetical protein